MEGPNAELASQVSDLLGGDLSVSSRSVRNELAVKTDVSEAVRQGHLLRAPKKVGCENIFFQGLTQK